MTADDLSRFGEWLKARRRELDLTQKEIAHSAGCSLSTIRKLEAGERRPSRQVAELLANHLEIEPGEREKFVRFARDSEGPASVTTKYRLPTAERPLGGKRNNLQLTAGSPITPHSSQPPTNLPAPLTSFVGRKAELERARQALWRMDTRLITMTGPGGTGKTRLASQVAVSVLDDFQDGVFFVELAPLTDPALVPTAIAQALGLTEAASRKPPVERVKEYLTDKKLLLVLDNFEQLTGAASVVDTLIRAAPHLKILVTSRAPLHLYGEREFPVPPLEVPSTEFRVPSNVDALGTPDAVRLFVERAQAVKPDFALTSENAPSVAEICARLDGLPLAIELAAARVKFLSPQALLSRLSSRLETLTGGPTGLPPRHRTLRDTIAWSYDLLDPGEQQLFRRMAAFQGGRTLEALEAVCGGIEGVESLVDKNLLQLREGEDGETRFWMLETIHEYAREKLVESGEGEALGNRHAAYFLALAEEGDEKLRGAEQLHWLARLAVERDNLRAALGWVVQHGDGEAALRLVSALNLFWRIRSYVSEGREHIVAALSLPGTPLLRARALCAAGDLAAFQDDYAASRLYIEESLAIARELGSKKDIAAALFSLGRVASYDGDYAVAQSCLEQSLSLWQELGDKWSEAITINGLGFLANRQGDWQAHHAHVEKAVHLLRDVGDTWARARALNNLGVSLRVYHADYARASEVAEETLSLCRALGDKQGIGLALANIGISATSQGALVSARLFMERALVVFREIGYKHKVAETNTNLSETARLQGDYAQAQAFAEQGLQLYEGMGVKTNIAFSLQSLGMAAACREDYNRALTLLEWSEALYNELGPLDVMGAGLEDIATVARWRGAPGDLERATAVLDKALAWRSAHESRGNRVIAAHLMYERGMVALQRGEREQAASSIKEALAIFEAFGCRYDLALCFSALATLAASDLQSRDSLIRAARLGGVADALMESLGGQIPPRDRAAYHEALAAARGRLGEPRWQAVYAEGRAMSYEAAVEWVSAAGEAIRAL